MVLEEIKNILSQFGFAETLNKVMGCTKITHVIHSCPTPKKIVEYYADNLGIIDFVWAYVDGELKLIDSMSDFEIWLKR